MGQDVSLGEGAFGLPIDRPLRLVGFAPADDARFVGMGDEPDHGGGLAANEIVAVVSAWQNGALSRDSMLDMFRRGEVLPEGRTYEEERALVKSESRTANCTLDRVNSLPAKSIE
jgi:hypothetical protein